MLLTPLGIEKIKKLKALNNSSWQEFAKMGTPKLSLFNPMTKLFRRAYLGDTIISKTHSLYHFRKKWVIIEFICLLITDVLKMFKYQDI